MGQFTLTKKSAMAREIEDKYLVTNDSWRDIVQESTHITQTYLYTSRALTVRTRLETNRPAIFCIKLAERKDGTPEYEWRMPRWLASICSKWQSRTLRKIRNRVPWGTLVIEVDEFLGNLAGLVMAEVELPAVGFPYEAPIWFGREVTRDKRYKNVLLLQNGVPD